MEMHLLLILEFMLSFNQAFDFFQNIPHLLLFTKIPKTYSNIHLWPVISTRSPVDR